MDRERLKEVKATDLTEANINEEFVDWLKTKGVSWLLVILVALTVYLAIVRWRQSKDSHRFEAWNELQKLSSGTALPASFVDVADDYPDVDSVSELAKLSAAQMLMRSVQAGTKIGGDEVTGLPQPLIADDRTAYLNRADDLYSDILGELKANDLSTALLAINALNGRAAVAEARDQPAEAKQYYEQAAARAEKHYPELARQARKRAESVENMLTFGPFPSATDLQATLPDPTARDAVIIDPAIADMLIDSNTP